MRTDLAPRVHLTRRGRIAALLTLIVISGALLRLNDLDAKSLTHPEAYIPGIDLPDRISEPPPRLTLYTTIWWHFHDEPHPQGYYFMMWIWTKLFGTTLYAMRLPSVLFGIGSILLIFWVASLLHDSKVALLSAALLAFNGHHIYWDQMARMYSLTCFLGLLSTLLWLQLMCDSSERRLKEALYVAVSVLGVFTEILFWPFLAAQIAWTTLHQKADRKGPSRILVFQALIVIIGSPIWAHAIYRSRPSPLDGFSWSFLQEFLSFGFLFEFDWESDPFRDIPLMAKLFLVTLAILCISRALSDRGRKLVSPSLAGGFNVRHLLPVAAGAILVILTMATVAHRRRWSMSLTSIVPVMAVFMPQTFSLWWYTVRRKVERVRESLSKYFSLIPSWRSPFVFLAFIPPVIVFLVSFYNHLVASRLFLLFTPYLLIIIAVGARRLFADRVRSHFIGFALAISIFAIHVLSVAYYRDRPSDVIDYQDLARKIIADSIQDDLIFVRRRNWVTTPMFYYLNKNQTPLVAENFQDAVTRHPGSRIWVLEFKGTPPPPTEAQAALTNFHLQKRIASRRGAGSLYVRGD